MRILEQFFEGWIEPTMRKHDRIQAGEDVKLSKLNLHSNKLDQIAEDFEQRMEMTAVEFEKWMRKISKK